MTLSTTRCFIHLCRFYCHLFHVIDNWFFFHLRYLLFDLLEVVCPSPEEDIYGIDSSSEHVTCRCLKSYKNGLDCRMKTGTSYLYFLPYHHFFLSGLHNIFFSILNSIYSHHIFISSPQQLEVYI